ncbi:hypothetical protein YN1_4220 [Nanoarchaeota archaeon]
MVVLPKNLKIKRRYILVENIDKNKLREDYINFFGYIDFYKSNIEIIKINNFYVISVNKKNINKIIFLLYLQRIKPINIFKTIKSIKRFLNIS